MDVIFTQGRSPQGGEAISQDVILSVYYCVLLTYVVYAVFDWCASQR